MTRICFLNIMHGSTISKSEKILEKLKVLKPEIISFSEFRKNRVGEFINKSLLNEGYKYSNFESIDEKGNNVIIYSKSEFELLKTNENLPDQRIIEIKYKSFIFLFVHIPGIKNARFSKKVIWDELYRFLINTSEKSIMIGDFNTGLENDSQGISFKYNLRLKELIDSQFIDLWRNFNNKDEYTWYSNVGNGFRVDHAITQAINKQDFINCYYNHSIRFNKLSDHSMILIDMND